MKKNSSRVHHSRQCNDMDNYLRTREFEVMILIHCHTFGEWTYWNPDCNAWKMNAMTFIFQPTTQNLGPKLRNIFMLLRLWRKSSWEWHYFFHSCQVILVIKSWNDVDKRTYVLLHCIFRIQSKYFCAFLLIYIHTVFRIQSFRKCIENSNLIHISKWKDLSTWTSCR